jgi:putative membrane protein
MRLIIRLLVNALIVFVLAWALPGIAISSYWTALVVAIILGFLNIFLKPILVLITIPVTVITLGIFLLVINAFIIILADIIINGFVVDNFWWALLFGLLLSFFNSAFDRSSKQSGRKR